MKENIFFKKVYEIVKKIPRGKVATYGQIADEINSLSTSSRINKKISPQLVGWALHANKDSKTPCHRVVNKEGSVALNYAFGGGWREQKMRLLSEGVAFIDEMHVDLEKFLWNPNIK